jgi:hypothetical protein
MFHERREVSRAAERLLVCQEELYCMDKIYEQNITRNFVTYKSLSVEGDDEWQEKSILCWVLTPLDL